MKFFKEGLGEKIFLPVVLLIAVAVFLIYSGQDEKIMAPVEDNSKMIAAIPVDPTGISTLEKSLEDKIASNLENIKGVGKTKVLVTYTSGCKKEYAKNESITKKNSKETDKEGGIREIEEITETSQLVIAGNSNPVVVVEQRPEIAGVLVISQGANDPKIKEQIFEAVRTLLNIDPTKINVAPLGGI